MTGCVKRRSTFTTTVLSCLSLTTTPCKTRFGIFYPLSLRLSRFLAAQRLHAGDVPTDFAHATGILELTRGTLEAQIELLLLQSEQLVLELVPGHRLEVREPLVGLHGLLLTRRCAG